MTEDVLYGYSAIYSVKFKSALHRQHSKSIIERSAFVEKQAPSERLQKHSYAGKTAVKGQRRDIY